jgi:hypothetical protein
MCWVADSPLRCCSRQEQFSSADRATQAAASLPAADGATDAAAFDTHTRTHPHIKAAASSHHAGHIAHECNAAANTAVWPQPRLPHKPLPPTQSRLASRPLQVGPVQQNNKSCSSSSPAPAHLGQRMQRGDKHLVQATRSNRATSQHTTQHPKYTARFSAQLASCEHGGVRE